MNETETVHASASESVAYEPCPCRQIANGIQQLLGVSPAARQHLENSRIEFLKAMRAVLDQRIERMSGQQRQGTRVVVE